MQTVDLPVKVSRNQIDRISRLVLDTVSVRSQRDYSRALSDFIHWHQETGASGLTKETVQAHVAHLKAHGVPASSINQRLAAIRKLAYEAADNGLIPESQAQAIGRVQNIKRQGKRLGNWLTCEQASAMISAPPSDTLIGQRDRALLAVMLGAGLRRDEVSGLTVEHLAQREGRWVILDLVGKHNRTRTVPIAPWVKTLIDQWTHAARITTGPLFRPVLKGGRVQPGAMTSQAIWYVVQKWAPVPKLAPHDLRRTFAKLADKAGSSMEQIQFTLGHASIQTTEAYIGAQQDLHDAPSDKIRLEIT